MPLQPFKQSHSVPQRCRRSGISSRNYSVVEMYPPASSLGLEADPSAPGHVASEPQPNSNAEINLALEKVDNWTSRANADAPFRPDFTMFEPVEPILFKPVEPILFEPVQPILFEPVEPNDNISHKKKLIITTS